MAKRRKKKRIWPKVILMIVLLAILLMTLLLLLFHIKEMEVQGIVYASKQEVVDWVKKDKFSTNGIYVWWKCKYSKEPKPAAIDKMDVKFKTPWSICVKVVEKKPIGFLNNNDEYLYFTQDGIAIYKTKQKIENISYIEGIELKNAKVQVGKKIPVADEKVFRRIVEISEIMQKLKLKPDRVVCSGSGFNVYFSGIEVLLGKNAYDVKLAQLPPILKILNEKYKGIEGTLYLEHYEKIEQGIRFVPKKEESQSTKETPSSTGENANVDEQTQEKEQPENTEVIEYTTEQEGE